MGNTQANEKQSKTGKSPAKGKHFIRNLKGRDSKKHGRKKSDAKREVIDKEFDKTPDSDNNEPIEISDNDMVECVFKTLARQGKGAESSSVQSEVTVTRCEPRAQSRSPTRDQSPAAVAPPAVSPANDSTSESVFTDPLTPLAVELNQCYYSAESDSAPDDLPRTLTPPFLDVPASVPTMTVDMPHEDATSSLSADDIEKEEKNDVFDDSTDKAENEKVMGTVFSGLCGDTREEILERGTHECDHDFRDNRLKACAGQTSFTVSKHRKVELPPVEPSLTLLDNVVSEKDRRHSSVSDTPMTESNVLRKVASLTLDKHTESKVIRPKFVPDKLDFKLYEKFEGQMLLNWFISSITENNHFKTLWSNQDLRNLGIQYCTHLLAAGVLRQISDKDAPTENIFKPNLMYYWAHMEVPTLQPVTPGRLHTSVWPPDKDTHTFFTQDNQRDLENNKFFSQNNNEEISDIDEAKVVISQLKKKLQELEYQLEKYRINSQIESLNKNLEKRLDSINEYNIIRNKTELVNNEVQSSNFAIEINKLSNNKAVINIPEYDPLRTNVNIDRNLDISSLDHKSEMAIKDIASKPDVRSDKIVNYCKLNKSRDCNKTFIKDEILELEDAETNKDVGQFTQSSEHTSVCSSNISFLSTHASTDFSAYSAKSSLDVLKNEVVFKNASCSTTEVLYTAANKHQLQSTEERQLSKSFIDHGIDRTVGYDDYQITSERQAAKTSKSNSHSSIEHFSPVEPNTCSQGVTCPPPPLPGMTPPPPPMPGTPDLQIHETHTSKSEMNLSKSPILQIMPSAPQLSSANVDKMSPGSPSVLNSVVASDSDTWSAPKIESNSLSTPTFFEPKTSISCIASSAPPSMTYESIPKPTQLDIDSQSTLITETGLPPPPDIEPIPPSIPIIDPSPSPTLPGMDTSLSPMPEETPSPPMSKECPPSEPIYGMGPPPPPLSGMGPLPPPMPDMGPSPPSTPGMGPPSPPMPELEPILLPMPEMGPPPPPMPGIEPTPPLMPEMGPPPPMMPGMGPPPPPMPGMGPPPPPMPGMGPPPPPMPGMGPPPPPMPGMGPPPPPMPGMGPPPPPMPGMGPPPPPMPGMGPPPPPIMPGMGPPPPPLPGMGGPPPPPSIPGMGPPPPPSLSGPVPFPAPPVGGWNVQRATLRKTPIKPSAPMKPLYWTRILAAPPPPSQEEASTSKLKPLWLEIEETNLDNIDEFTDLFSRQVVKAPVKKKVEVKTKIQPVKILDSKRSQNVGILAKSLHVEFSEIENAIYHFDTSVVSLEALQQIYELRGSEEELSLIKEHLKNKPDVPLDKPEAFLHDLSGIPNFAERISCFMFQAEFEDAVSTTMHKLDNLKHTCEFLMTSENLKKLFAIILTLGNYMNGGNGQRGQADGFGLEILSKLKDVKSKQSNVTLLHFIVRTFARAMGGALGGALPVPEPGDVARAAALDFADVAAHLAALRTQLDGCKEKTEKVIENYAQASEESGDEDKRRLEVFKDKMTAFINSAEEKLKTENENLEECRAKFIATVKFYQYSPKGGKPEDCEPKDFFSLWTSFCSDLKDIYKKEEQIAIKEKLKEAKKLQEERKPLTQPKKEGGLKARLQKLSSTTKK